LVSFQGFTFVDVTSFVSLEISPAPLLHRFLPSTLTVVLKEEGADKMLNLFDGESDTPELIWESSMRAELRGVVGQLLDACIDERRKTGAGNEVFVLDPSTRVTYKNLSDELFVGGVYVSRFLKEPTYNLRDPTKFLEMLMQRWTHELQRTTSKDSNTAGPRVETTTLTMGGTDTLLSVTNASVYICKVRSNLNEKLSQWGYMSRCLTFLDTTLACGLYGTPLLSIMRILHVAVNSRPNMENLIVSGKNDRSHGVVALTMRAIEADELHKDTSFMLEMMKKLFAGVLGDVKSTLRNARDFPHHAYAMAPSPAPGDGPVSRNRVARGHPLDDPLALPAVPSTSSAQGVMNPAQYQTAMPASTQQYGAHASNPLGRSSFPSHNLPPTPSSFGHSNVTSYYPQNSLSSASGNIHGTQQHRMYDQPIGSNFQPQNHMYGQSTGSNFQPQNTQYHQGQSQMYDEQHYQQLQQQQSLPITANVQQQSHFSSLHVPNPPVVQSGGYAQRSANMRGMTQHIETQNLQRASGGLSQATSYDYHTQQRASQPPQPNFQQSVQQEGNYAHPSQDHSFAHSQQQSQNFQHVVQPQYQQSQQHQQLTQPHQQPQYQQHQHVALPHQHPQYQQSQQHQQLQAHVSPMQPVIPPGPSAQYQQQQQGQNEVGTSGSPDGQATMFSQNSVMNTPGPFPSMSNQLPIMAATTASAVCVETIPDASIPVSQPPPQSNAGSGVDARIAIDPKVDAERRMKTVSGAPGAADGRVPLLQSALLCDLPNFIVNQVLESPKLKEIKDPAAAKVHGVELLKLLTQDPGYGMKFEQILSENPQWKKYNAQDHSLFITGPEQRADYFLTDGSNGEAKKLLTHQG
jgi:hypothetical protein